MSMVVQFECLKSNGYLVQILFTNEGGHNSLHS